MALTTPRKPYRPDRVGKSPCTNQPPHHYTLSPSWAQLASSPRLLFFSPQAMQTGRLAHSCAPPRETCCHTALYQLSDNIPNGTQYDAPLFRLRRSSASSQYRHSPSIKMMVPRAYIHTQVQQPRTQAQREKEPRSTPRRPPMEGVQASDNGLVPRILLRAASEPVNTTTTTTTTTPVKIPQRKSGRLGQEINPGRSSSAEAVCVSVPGGEPSRAFFSREGGARSLLEATVIPPRKRPRPRPSQRLPKGDYVADFSRLLLDDVISSEDGTIPNGFGSPHFDALFGNINELVEGQEFVEREELHESLMSVRSVSSESMPSLADDSTGTSLNEITSPNPHVRRLNLDRKAPQYSSSQECAEDHPLLHSDDLSFSEPSPPPLPSSEVLNNTPLPVRSSATKPRTSYFRSNLTASLRAIKSAAQTFSSFAANPPMLQPEDFLARSIFTIAPELTDDKRPPPSDELPSAALRRYLNPPPGPSDSPAALHIWHEPLSSLTLSSKTKSKKSKQDPSKPPAKPLAIPLQTCIPTSRRSSMSGASSPPIWLGPDGTPTNRATADSLSVGSAIARQREPRENSDFLRILVAEMNMRRNGKLGEETDSHACMWLPPRKVPDKRTVKTGKERWPVTNAGAL